MIRHLLFLGMLGCALLLAPQLALAEEPVGSVKTLKGEVLVERGGMTSALSIGLPVYQGDTLRSGENAGVGIVLRDDTLISMGPGSTLVLKEYIFEPKSERYSVILGMLKGTFTYLSGVIGKLAPETIRLETPDSTIAVRGTRLLVKVN